MGRLTCVQMELLLERRRSGLTEGERLRLETHLGSCERCRSEARWLEAAVVFSEQAASAPLSSSGRERAIERALSRGPLEEVPAAAASEGPRWRLALAGVALVGSVAATVLLMLRPASPPAEPSRRAVVARTAQETSAAAATTPQPPPVPQLPSAPERPPEAALASLLSGDLRIDGREARVGQPLPEGAQLATGRGAQLRVARAELVLAADSTVSWSGQAGTGPRVQLVRGRVTASLDPALRAQLSLATSTFLVEVVGTRFSVAERRVEVTEGQVRVLSLEGAELARLGPGEHWNAPATAAPGTAASAPRPSAQAQALEVGPHLRRARHLLARGEVVAARAEIAQALRGRPARREEGEARSLLAECALVAGSPREAGRLYLQVARRYGDLSSGENALYAAARLEGLHGRPEVARDLLHRYLARYPQGQLRKETLARLRALEGK